MKQPEILLNELLEQEGVPAAKTLLMRHRPTEPKLNRVFDSIAGERPDLFDCYQSTHGPRTQAALLRAEYLVSTIRHTAGHATFVGLYEIRGSRVMTNEQAYARPLHQRLIELGMTGDFAFQGNTSVHEFDLRRTDWGANWSGRLILKWPGTDRAWYQWLGRNRYLIHAIAEHSVLSPPIPDWQDLSLSWQELAVLPTNWQHALRQWRGIYLITDELDRMRYVGSAAGGENLLQRWLNYAQSGHGGNVRLRQRDPASFRFAILQRLSPDAPLDEVQITEASWKVRLGTRWPHGLNEN